MIIVNKLITSTLFRILLRSEASLSLYNNLPFLSTFRISPIAKKTGSAPLPNVQDKDVVNQFLTHNRRFNAIALAMHYPEKDILYAVLAPKTAQGDLKEKWKVAGSRLSIGLKNGQNLIICVPMDKDTTHLPLKNCVLR